MNRIAKIFPHPSAEFTEFNLSLIRQTQHLNPEVIGHFPSTDSMPKKKKKKITERIHKMNISTFQTRCSGLFHSNLYSTDCWKTLWITTQNCMHGTAMANHATHTFTLALVIVTPSIPLFLFFLPIISFRGSLCHYIFHLAALACRNWGLTDWVLEKLAPEKRRGRSHRQTGFTSPESKGGKSGRATQRQLLWGLLFTPLKIRAISFSPVFSNTNLINVAMLSESPINTHFVCS